MTYPIIKVKGNARERGLQYGQQAADRIKRSIETYEQTFYHYAGLSKPEFREIALTFESAIAAVDPRYVEELKAIAEGAEVEFADVLAINVRTEIMFSGMAKKTIAEQEAALKAECSTFALLPEKTDNDHTIIGQNWDWTSYAEGTVVVLEAEQSDGPNFVTIVEAGLLAKAGINAYGIGSVTNALINVKDEGLPGIPYHIALRAILDSKSISQAVSVLQKNSRASSANYLIGQAGGLAIDVECAPGTRAGACLLQPQDGYLVHTNHFLFEGEHANDVAVGVLPDTLFRYQAVNRDFKRENKLGVEAIQQTLKDHRNYPTSVCRHDSPEVSKIEDSVTVMSVIMDLDERKLWLADGRPCEKEYRELDYSQLLAQPV